MSRRAHIMPPVKGSGGHPDNVITFDVETRPATCDPSFGVSPCPACKRVDSLTPSPDDEVAVLTLGRALHTSGAVLAFDHASVFWEWVFSRTVHKQPLWLVNHNIAFDLMVLEFDHFLTGAGWVPDKVIMPEPSGPFMIRYSKFDHEIVLANLANWWGMRPLSSIGAVVGLAKGTVDPTEPRFRHGLDLDVLGRYCARDAQVVMKALKLWVSFCRDHDLGTFAPTQAGQSLNAFRHRFMAHEIYIHNNRRALSLEREAYMGARTEAFRIGRFTGSFHVLDVNSLYPFVMREFPFPTRLKGVINEISKEEYRQLRDSGALVIARCDLAVRDEETRIAPHRHQDRLIYPTGRFTSTLTTPELDGALSTGIVERLYDVAVYDSAPLFKSYVDTFYALRRQYHEAGNLVWYEIVKVFLNSLYGKFGQYNYEWDPCDMDLPTGVHVIWDAETDSRETYRSLGGVVRRRTDRRQESWTSFPAIAAHVTAYARRHITHLRARAGISNVWYMDTDSLFVDDTGMLALQGLVSGRLGDLKLECSAPSLVIRGLKDYEIGPKRKTKGVRRDALLSGGTARQVQFRGIAGAMRAGEPGVARIGAVTKTLSRKYTKGTLSDTYVIPLHLGD